jgi:hypothetical protein
MKKRRNMNKMEEIPKQNPVAKYAHQFNRTCTFADKSKYTRKGKHSRQEDFSVVQA